jgi:phenylpropionate dioxygenase-like ring-hydroxylating dioxygenase large terminal subunit
MFLRNAWYMAGWSETLTDRPLRLKIMGEGIALTRLSDGIAVAIGDRCPHRYASLSDGKLVDDALECPYHGLRFDRTGACVFNPHGDRSIPPGAKVKSYPLVERHLGMWIWMGDPALADETAIPDFSIFLDPQFVSSRDYLRIGANYELVTDNLLDLSHVEFLHPFLANPGFAERSRRDVKQEDSTIWAYLWNDNEPVTPLLQMLWDGEEDRGDLRSHMRWTAPSSLLLDVGITYRGAAPEAGPTMPSAHLLTPETEHSTHYFWAMGRNRRQEDAELTAAIHEGVANAFATEDEPMIARVAENLDGADFWELNPVILRGDAAAIRARRLLAKMIREEAAASASAPAPEPALALGR